LKNYLRGGIWVDFLRKATTMGTNNPRLKIQENLNPRWANLHWKNIDGGLIKGISI